MQHFGPNELLNDVIQKDLCIGCGACTFLCPYFRPHRGKVAMLFPCTLTEGRCFAHCPKIEVDLDELSNAFFGKPYETDPLGVHLSVKIAKAGEKAATGDFQAGGAVSALMMFALETNRIRAAVLTDRKGILPAPRLVTKPEEVLQCASSKYTSAPTLSALNQAIEDGYDKLGVVGTPCQILAVSKLRQHIIDKGDKPDPIDMVVGLFCTWSLDFRAFEAFISKKIDINTISKIDIPPPPAEIMEVYTQNGKQEIPLSEIRERVPDTCSYCVDMTAEFSDISVGVLEGRPDLNTIIIRTERGAALVDAAKTAGFLALDDMPKENLEHLIWAAQNKKKRAFEKGKEAGIINNVEKDERSFLRLSPKTLEGILSSNS